MKISDFQIHDTDKLDLLMTELVEMIIGSQQNDPQGFGMVAAGVLDPENRFVPALNHVNYDTGRHTHAERAAIEKYTSMHGPVPTGSIIITTLSPCTDPHSDEREGDSCNDLISGSTVHKVYCGYVDPTQEQDRRKTYHLQCTKNQRLQQLCKLIADQFL